MIFKKRKIDDNKPKEREMLEGYSGAYSPRRMTAAERAEFIATREINKDPTNDYDETYDKWYNKLKALENKE